MNDESFIIDYYRIFCSLRLRLCIRGIYSLIVNNLNILNKKCNIFIIYTATNDLEWIPWNIVTLKLKCFAVFIASSNDEFAIIKQKRTVWQYLITLMVEISVKLSTMKFETNCN